ncbi:hypothetical protein EJV46_07995, partial [Roseococcus sp. SYP-B2431]|uniref:hypothetical protein n=1 Tax=Roseococcus sp. SYP-B2431 TaxID=2496640 RepID=UPI00103F6F66
MSGHPSSAHGHIINATFGVFDQTTPWIDRRELPWTELAIQLTAHAIGRKEGSCIVPALFKGTERKKEDAERIDLVMLDSDSGATMDEISTALRGLGWAAVVSSTWSHLTFKAKMSRKVFDKWLSETGRSDTDSSAAEAFLRHRGMLPKIAAGATRTGTDEQFAYFQHGPCPKFRIALP